MKALSIRQPWASLVALGEKRIETRGWKTSWRGPLLIHAARSFCEVDRALCAQEPFKSALLRHGLKWPSDLPLGKIIGLALLNDCIPIADARPGEREGQLGDYEREGFAWRFTFAMPLEYPISCRGSLGVYEVDPDRLCSFLPVEVRTAFDGAIRDQITPNSLPASVNAFTARSSCSGV